MARKPMVTRTIPSTSVRYVAVEISSRAVTEKDILLPRTYKDAEAILSAINSQLDASECKAVSIVSANTVYNKYCMDEAKFIANADTVVPVNDDEVDE